MSGRYDCKVVDGGVELSNSCRVREEEGGKQQLWIPADWIRNNGRESWFAGSNQPTLLLPDLSADVAEVVECKFVEEEKLLGDNNTTSSTTAEVLPTLYAKLSDGKMFHVNSDKLFRYGLRSTAPEVTALLDADKITRVSFNEVVEKKSATVKKTMFSALLHDGIIIMTDCPEEHESAIRICRALAPTTGEHKTLYGDTFKVDTAPRAVVVDEGGSAGGQEKKKEEAAEQEAKNATRTGDGARTNLAYTGKFLDLHNDLPFYESMPGIQMLHCLQFDKSVTGGESFFVDAFAAAADLREKFPEDFEVLTKVPVPFMRDDANRQYPARYYSANPHISIDHTGKIRKVIWSPQNEGPMNLNLGAETLKAFYRAKKRFASTLLDWRLNKKLFFKMRPGETIIWNQVRVLHGRMAFEEPAPGLRRLHGAYTCIDDFAATARQYVEYEDGKQPDGAYEIGARVGNGSWM